MTPSQRILERVAELEGVPPSAIDEPLFETVAPDALDVLFRSVPDGPTRDDGEIRFAYLGYDVTVRAEGTVTVRSPFRVR
jgi:hypothetical protein